MKLKFEIRSVVLGVALGVVLAFTVAATTTGPISWEYSVVSEKLPVMPTHPDYNNIRFRNINQLSKEGWEILCEYMITYDEYNYSQNHNETRYARETILKRVKK